MFKTLRYMENWRAATERQLSDVFCQSVNIFHVFSVQSKWPVSRLYLQAAFLPPID